MKFLVVLSLFLAVSSALNVTAASCTACQWMSSAAKSALGNKDYTVEDIYKYVHNDLCSSQQVTQVNMFEQCVSLVREYGDKLVEEFGNDSFDSVCYEDGINVCQTPASDCASRVDCFLCTANADCLWSRESASCVDSADDEFAQSYCDYDYGYYGYNGHSYTGFYIALFFGIFLSLCLACVCCGKARRNRRLAQFQQQQQMAAMQQSIQEPSIVYVQVPQNTPMYPQEQYFIQYPQMVEGATYGN